MNRSTVALRRAWLAGGAVAMGTGIWSMHFVGMLALSLPMVVMYFVSEFICRANDRRRAERGDEFKVDLAESPAEVG